MKAVVWHGIGDIRLDEVPVGLRGIRVSEPGEVAAAWRQALDAHRPCLIEAITDPDTPMLAPGQPQEKVDQLIAGLDQEPDGARTAQRVRGQHEQEARHPG